MSNVQNRSKTYAIVAAVSIGILALSVVGGLWTSAPNTSVLPKANGNFIVTSNDDVRVSGEQGITSTGAYGDGAGNHNFVLFVTGTAFKKISPDKVSVTLGVETQEQTAQEAARKNAEIMNAVINGLKELGLNTNQISTSYFNVYPVYEYRKVEACIMIYPPPPECGGQVLVGYRVTNTITVTAPASENIGKVIDTAINAGANQVQSVSYFVSEEVQRQMSNELIEQAVLNAKVKAEKALAPLNMQIVGVKSLNLNDVYYPVYRYDKAVLAEGVAAPTPILPSEQQVSASVSVTFMIGLK
jgi:uncharacterized protein YggE